MKRKIVLCIIISFVLASKPLFGIILHISPVQE